MLDDSFSKSLSNLKEKARDILRTTSNNYLDHVHTMADHMRDGCHNWTSHNSLKDKVVAHAKWHKSGHEKLHASVKSASAHIYGWSKDMFDNMMNQRKDFMNKFHNPYKK